MDHGFKLHQEVIFGRRHGEQTRGEIIKLNPKKALVKILEERGNGRGSEVGSTWQIPYTMMRPADGSPVPVPAKPPQPALKYNQFDDNFHIYMAILGVYSHLSPENLSGDGEIPFHQVQRRRNELTTKLRHLQAAVGRQISESEIYAWHKDYQDSERLQKRI